MIWVLMKHAVLEVLDESSHGMPLVRNTHGPPGYSLMTPPPPPRLFVPTLNLLTQLFVSEWLVLTLVVLE